MGDDTGYSEIKVLADTSKFMNMRTALTAGFERRGYAHFK